MEKKKRPETLKGKTRLIRTGCRNLYITLNKDEKGDPFECFGKLGKYVLRFRHCISPEDLFECFAKLGKGGGCAACQNEAVSLLASLALRFGIPPEEIVTNIKGISCPHPYGDDDKKILSCADAIAKAIERFEANRLKMVEKEKADG